MIHNTPAMGWFHNFPAMKESRQKNPAQRPGRGRERVGRAPVVMALKPRWRRHCWQAPRRHHRPGTAEGYGPLVLLARERRCVLGWFVGLPLFSIGRREQMLGGAGWQRIACQAPRAANGGTRPWLSAGLTQPLGKHDEPPRLRAPGAEAANVDFRKRPGSTTPKIGSLHGLFKADQSIEPATKSLDGGGFAGWKTPGTDRACRGSRRAVRRGRRARRAGRRPWGGWCGDAPG